MESRSSLDCVTEITQIRQGFASLREGGLNWDAFPLRLFAKGNAAHWDPMDIDFSHDADDWASLNSEQRRSSTYLVALFVAGEEAVTQDILRSSARWRWKGGWATRCT